MTMIDGIGVRGLQAGLRLGGCSCWSFLDVISEL